MSALIHVSQSALPKNKKLSELIGGRKAIAVVQEDGAYSNRKHNHLNIQEEENEVEEGDEGEIRR